MTLTELCNRTLRDVIQPIIVVKLTFKMKFLCLIYFILLIESDLFAQSAAIKILPSIQTVGVDSAVSVSVKLEDIPEIHAYSIEVSYNPALLRYQSLVRLTFFSGWQTFYYPFIDTVNGTIRVDEAILGPYTQSGSGEVFKINFKTKAEGDCNLNLTTSELRNLDNQSIPSVLSNAVIKIRLVVNISDEESVNELLPKMIIYPNPFNSIAAIQFNSGSNEIVSLKIFDIKGEEILNFNLNSFQNNGTVIWNGKNSNGSTVTSGIYFIRLEMPNNFLVKKAILLK